MSTTKTLTKIIAGWSQIYRDHWKKCKKSTCHHCCRTNEKSWFENIKIFKDKK